MTGYEIYCEYVSLKRHFSDWRYDYERYGGPARIKPETFEKRPDAFRFRKLAARPSARWSIVAALARKDGAWVGDCLGRDAEIVRDESLGRVQAMPYFLEKETAALGDDLAAAVLPEYGKHPLLARTVLWGKVSVEVGSAIVGLTGATTRWRDEYSDDPVMESLTRRLTKLFPLMTIDIQEASRVLAARFRRGR